MNSLKLKVSHFIDRIRRSRPHPFFQFLLFLTKTGHVLHSACSTDNSRRLRVCSVHGTHTDAAFFGEINLGEGAIANPNVTYTNVTSSWTMTTNSLILLPSAKRGLGKSILCFKSTPFYGVTTRFGPEISHTYSSWHYFDVGAGPRGPGQYFQL